MEKGRKTKIITILALIIGVVGLSIGFSAFSRNLEITNIQGTITPGEQELDVIFDNDQIKDNELDVVKGQGEGAVVDEVGAIITNPELNSASKPTIDGLTANFTKKGDKVIYEFYTYNNSPYDAYLNELSFISEPYKKCEAIDKANTNETLVQNACNDIILSLKVDGITILSTADSSPVSHRLTPGRWKTFEIEISYKGTKYPLPDGAMKVTFSGIRIGYSTVKPY